MASHYSTMSGQSHSAYPDSRLDAQAQHPSVQAFNQVEGLLHAPQFQRVFGSQEELNSCFAAARVLKQANGGFLMARETGEYFMAVLGFLERSIQSFPQGSPFAAQVIQLKAQIEPHFHAFKAQFEKMATGVTSPQSSAENLPPKTEATELLKAFAQHFSKLSKVPENHRQATYARLQQNWLQRFQELMTNRYPVFEAVLDLLISSSSTPARTACITIVMKCAQGANIAPQSPLAQRLERLQPNTGLQHSQLKGEMSQRKTYAFHEAPADVLGTLDQVLSQRPPLAFVEKLQKVFEGRYQNLTFVAQGGMGAIIKAYSPKTNRNVALKFNTNSTDEALIEGFLREGRAAAEIGSHANIVAVHDVSEAALEVADSIVNIPYIAFEFIDGGKDCKHIIDVTRQAKRPLPVEAVLHLVRQAAQGLNAAHKRGTVHRDIKLDNILVPQDIQIPLQTWTVDADDEKLTTSIRRAGGLKIGDFGLAGKRPDPEDLKRSLPQAKMEADGRTLTGNGELIGTPLFFPPEILDPSSAGKKWDVYDLGLVMYMLLTGHQFPLEYSKGVTLHDNVMNIVTKIINTDAPAVAGPDKDPHIKALIERNRKHNKAIVAFLQRLTAQDENERPTMGEVIEICDQLLHERSAIVQEAKEHEQKAKQEAIKKKRAEARARKAREQAEKAKRTKTRFGIAFAALVGLGTLGGVVNAISSRREQSRNMASLNEKVTALDTNLADGYDAEDELKNIKEAREFLLQHFDAETIASTPSLTTAQQTLDNLKTVAELISYENEKSSTLATHKEQAEWSAMLTTCDEISTYLDGLTAVDHELYRTVFQRLRSLVTTSRTEAREGQTQINAFRETLTAIQRDVDAGKVDDALSEIQAFTQQENIPGVILHEAVAIRVRLRFRQYVNAYHRGDQDEMRLQMRNLERDSRRGLSEADLNRLNSLQERASAWTDQKELMVAADEAMGLIYLNNSNQPYDLSDTSQRAEVVQRLTADENVPLSPPQSLDVQGFASTFRSKLRSAATGNREDFIIAMNMYGRAWDFYRQVPASAPSTDPTVRSLRQLYAHATMILTEEAHNLIPHADLSPEIFWKLQKFCYNALSHYKDQVTLTAQNGGNVQVFNSNLALMMRAGETLLQLYAIDSTVSDTNREGVIGMLNTSWHERVCPHYRANGWSIDSLQQQIIQNINPAEDSPLRQILQTR